MNTICFITPGHISTNPRLVKEATTLAALNYKVHIVFTQYNIKQIPEDEAILNRYRTITFDVLNWSGSTIRSSIIKLSSAFRQIFSKKLLFIFPSLELKKTALNRNYDWQLKKAIAVNADLYIAHILPSLPIAILAAQKLGAKAGFDAEDFHRYESSNNDKTPDVKMTASFEEKYMPHADYLTAASPLIALEYEKIVGKKMDVILNVFPTIDKNENQRSDLEVIKLFWFSQTIGPNRGIETIIKALGILGRKDIELHLLGEVSTDYRIEIKNLSRKFNLSNHCINFHKTIGPDEIPKFTEHFDVGISSEISNPLNRDICLTNKIFTYCQNGLAIIASDTSAQKRLLEENPSMGYLYEKNDSHSLASVIRQLCENKVKLNEAKTNSLHYSKTKFNWELEQKKFLSIIQSL